MSAIQVPPGLSSIPGVEIRKGVVYVPPFTELTRIDFKGANLEGAELSYVRFTSCNFTGANLIRANLHDTRIEDCNFTEANLEGANFEGSILKDAIFDNTNMVNANFKLSDIHVKRINMKRDLFSGTNFESANLYDLGISFDSLFHTSANTMKANMRGSTNSFQKFGNKLREDRKTQYNQFLQEYNKLQVPSGLSSIPGVEMRNGVVYVPPFTELRGDFKGANLEGAELSYVRFTSCNFTGANLRGANLHDTRIDISNFTEADLEGANFEGSIIKDARFDNTNMVNANFSLSDIKAETVNMNMTSDSFRGTNFEAADLSRSNISFQLLISSSANTKMANMPYNPKSFYPKISSEGIKLREARQKQYNQLLQEYNKLLQDSEYKKNINIRLENYLINRLQTTPIKHQPTTITNRLNVINDACVTNTTSPYLIHYEEYNGKPYPIITIPQGLMLFNGRRYVAPDLSTSFHHLYKLHDHPTLQSYIDDIDDTYTYFFPMPTIYRVWLESGFRTMDVVTTTKDIRLLALISPSPIERMIRHGHVKPFVTYTIDQKKVYNNVDLHSCRGYDLCIDPEVIKNLNLNGCICLTEAQSVSNVKSEYINEIMDNKFEESLLFRGCTFNNSIKDGSLWEPDEKYNLPNFEFIKKKRLYGTPEIVLIPLDIHRCTTDKQYNKINAEFQTNTSSVNSDMFIFKPLHAVFGDEYQMVVELDKYLTKQKHRISKSYQAPHLFSLWIPETRSTQFICDKEDFALEELNFVESYLSTNPGLCAFESMDFYSRISRFVKENLNSLNREYEKENENKNAVIVGGRDLVTVRHTNKELRKITNRNKSIKNASTSNRNKINKIIIRKSRSRSKSASKVQKKFSNLIDKLNETVVSNKKLFFDKEGEFYYSEKSGIPVLFLKNEK
jgi:uncharacterized protein YjbI with pentapeptide repeats